MKSIFPYLLMVTTSVFICCTDHRNNSGTMTDSSMRTSDTTTKSKTLPITPGGDGTNSPAEDSTRRHIDSMKK